MITKPACGAPVNHRPCSQSRGRTYTRCVRVLVCARGARHELYMSCAPASLCRPHAALLTAASSPRRSLQGTRAAWAVCSSAAARCVHATGVDTLASTYLLPAAAELLLFRLLLLLSRMAHHPPPTSCFTTMDATRADPTLEGRNSSQKSGVAAAYGRTDRG